MKLSVVIVNYKVKYFLEQCLLSLGRALEGIEAEVYVVDNHSQDGSVEYLSERFPHVHFIASNHNLGFARGNNLAIRQSQSEYVLLLNPDTVVGEHVVSHVLDFMDTHKAAGGVGVRMMKANGGDALESRRGLPTPATAFYKMIGLCSRYPRHHRFGRYYMGFLSWDEPARIEIISGAFCMLRREALTKVGLLDEDFFMYGEDIDLSYRLLKGGYENWYFPERILHYKGESTHKSSFRYVHVFYEAMLIFFRKHYSGMTLLFSFPIKCAIYAKALSALGQMMLDRLSKYLGLASKNRPAEPKYIFVTSAEHMAACKNIVKLKGLAADYIMVDGNELSGQLLRQNFESGHYIYMVYDFDIFDIEDILSHFANNTAENVSLGLWNHKNRILITAEETLC